jgi:hypothetical protein
MTPDLTEHTFLEMVRSRVYGILAGYEDQNDHDTLRADPVFELVADRSPDESDLASRPTLSRFEKPPPARPGSATGRPEAAPRVPRYSRTRSPGVPSAARARCPPEDQVPGHGRLAGSWGRLDSSGAGPGVTAPAGRR